MKKEALNYEAAISCYNGAYARFSFHADSAELAKDHVAHILSSENTIGFDWQHHPGQFHYILYTKIGNKKSKYIYTNKPYQKPEPDLTMGDYIKLNHTLILALKEVSDSWRGMSDSCMPPHQRRAIKLVDDTLMSLPQNFRP